MHRILDFVNFALAGCKFLIRRNRGRHIACITRLDFRTCVNQEQIARFHFISVIMVVQRLPVDGGDRCKRQFAVVGLCHAIHFRYYFIFVHSRTKHLHGGDVHIGSHVTGFFYFYDFFRRLVVALSYDGTDERYGTFLTCRWYSEPVHQFQFMFGAVGRKIMNCFSTLDAFVQIADDIGGSHHFPDADAFAFFA